MGSCFSSSTPNSPTSKVINANGSLIEFSQPIKVSHVLPLNHKSFFLCNADALFYGHHIEALDANHVIQPGKIYFLLPKEKLKYPLTAGEMEAMAVRANSAFADVDLSKKTRRKKKTKKKSVMPVIAVMESDEYESFNESSVGSFKFELRGFRKRESVVKKPNFRPRLSIIEEVYE